MPRWITLREKVPPNAVCLCPWGTYFNC